jgi:phospholipid-binding lipoprotein MlaA|tara:strand:- start:5712 stop:6473 length:762 start_codon:yes stop_codon:yes gene_type:complete
MIDKMKEYIMSLNGFFAIFLLASLSFCPKAAFADVESDPWEGMNRSIFEFNEGLDKYVAKPVAQGYQAVTPQIVDTGITNFFSNLEDVLIVVNDIFQLKPLQAASDTARFVVNSTVGLLGFFDVASHIGLPKHNEDLGQTLGYWGVGEGPYLMLPLLGPSNLRDSFGLAGDSFSGLSYTDIAYTSAQTVGLITLKNVDLRADLIASEGLITGERYTFLRSFYQQRRAYLVNDGASADDFEDDFDDEDFDDEDF